MSTFPSDKGRPAGGWGSGTGEPRAINRISPRQKDIMRRLLLGQTQKEIADYLGYSPVRVSQIVNSPVFKRAFQMYEATFEEMFTERLVDKKVEDPIKEKLDLYKVDAIDTMYELMNQAESDNVRRASAQDILDRAGYKPRDVVETSHSFKVDPETATNINRALVDLGVDLEGIQEEFFPDEESHSNLPSVYDESDPLAEREED